MRVWPIALILLLASCAGPTPRPEAARSPEPGPVDRGRTFVQRACAGCHAIGSGAQSPNPHAPPFWQVGQKMDDLSLQVALAAVSHYGHGEMPPIAIVGGEVSDVAQYIKSLKPPADRSARQVRRQTGKRPA